MEYQKSEEVVKKKLSVGSSPVSMKKILSRRY
jgi:hypothetical protein